MPIRARQNERGASNLLAGEPRAQPALTASVPSAAGGLANALHNALRACQGGCLGHCSAREPVAIERQDRLKKLSCLQVGIGHTYGVPLPGILVVDDRGSQLGLIVEALVRRFGSDYEVQGSRSAVEALAILERWSTSGTSVAIVLAWEGLADGDAIELLMKAGAIHQSVQRVLVISRGQWGSCHPAVEAMTLGRIDQYLFDPRMADERWFYLPVSTALARWGHAQPSPYNVIEVVGDEWAQASHEVRSLLARIGIPFAFHSVTAVAGSATLRRVGRDGSTLPVLVFQSGIVLEDPSIAQIGAALGFATSPPQSRCDVAIIGAGPAGLAAAVYAASEGLQTLLIESGLPGGQAGTSSMIRNYLGFQHGVTGDEFGNRAVEQAWLFGADLVVGRAAIDLAVDGADRVVRLSGGGLVHAATVVITCGVTWRRLGVPDLDRLLGAGVFYGAAGGETKAVRDAEVFVVGGGNSAGQAAVHLAGYARSVTILIRSESLASSMSDYLIQEITAHERIEVRRSTQIVGGGGSARLEWVTLRHLVTGEVETVPASAVFVMIGAEPHTDWLPADVERDRGGYVKTGYDLLDGRRPPAQWPLARLPYLLECSIPGVFAAGDVRHRSVKRVASAAGEGATAIQLVHEYLEQLRA